MHVEKQILELGGSTDQATREMLQSVLNKKRKYDRYKKNCFKWQMFTLFGGLVYFLYVYQFIVVPNGSNIGYMLGELVGSVLHFFVVLLLGSGYATARYYKKKEEKYEKEYHGLRTEIIRKSSELWPQPYHWKKRGEVYDMMKKHYDINLYFESK
ncbi:hypothetical protein AZ46_0208875 [Metabacillus indicus LMG 22858]|uniref:DUF2663 domain-containing protein n=1 Tax=Metabacillus indicus TaxID=246786 RepID=A0A084H0G7_METID|nr:hypothetical protein AZ46_0208875 [Metabacillus indicus LMG 22858]KEZ53079.1 hypothetical protein GS18_0209735 [Metabacillus indicus]